MVQDLLYRRLGEQKFSKLLDEAEANMAWGQAGIPRLLSSVDGLCLWEVLTKKFQTRIQKARHPNH